jgi:hypothetical protein
LVSILLFASGPHLWAQVPAEFYPDYAKKVMDHPEEFNISNVTPIRPQIPFQEAIEFTKNQVESGTCRITRGVVGEFDKSDGSVGSDAYVFSFHKKAHWDFWDQSVKFPPMGYVEIGYRLRFLMEPLASGYLVTIALDQGNFSTRGRGVSCFLRSEQSYLSVCDPVWQTIPGEAYSLKVNSIAEIDTDAFAKDAVTPKPVLSVPSSGKIVQLKCVPH